MSGFRNAEIEKFPDHEIDLHEIQFLFREKGCTALFVKELAWNHDSKRQIYLAADLAPFSQLPNRLESSPPLHPSIKGTSKKKSEGAERIFGHLNFFWLSRGLTADRARQAKLIFYPQYPETRLSGFLQGSNTVPGKFLREKSGEVYENRLLFLGTDNVDKTYGYLAVGHSDLREEIRGLSGYSHKAGLNRIETHADSTSEQRLLSALKRIHLAGWHDGVRLKRGEMVGCSTPQAVGYTLETLLNIEPNSRNAPDFEGYEVKALTVSKAGWGTSKAVTMMAPEPDIGLYCKSIRNFIEAYGYPDRTGKPERQNFGGIHRHGTRHHLTGLLLDIVGYSVDLPSQIDRKGFVALVDERSEIAAAWSFAKLIEAWKNKHEKAVFVQAFKREGPNVAFHYLNEVQICEGADFYKFLRSIAEGNLYIDPGVKAEKWQTQEVRFKKRTQFRTAMDSISGLYGKSKYVRLI